MLWGHCIQYCITGSGLDFFENSVFRFIYSFHMPLFMLISGYLFHSTFSRRSLKELLVYRTQSLLQPIVFCSIFNYLVTTALFGVLKGNLGVLVNGKWMAELSSLWFLWSVLSASLATSLVCKLTDRLGIQILLFFLMIPFVAVFPNMERNLFMYPYFVLGFYYARYQDKLPAFVHKLRYLTLPLFPLLLRLFERKHYIYTTGLFPGDGYSLTDMVFIDGFRWFIGLVGSVFAITVLQLTYQHISVKLSKPLISRGLSALGRVSLQIYAFSVPFLSDYLYLVFKKSLVLFGTENIFTRNLFVYNYVFTLGLAVAYGIGLYLFVKILGKTKISKLMFGK